MVAYSGYNTNPDPATWTATDNVAVSVPSVTLSGLKEYNTIKTYLPGDTVIYNNGILQCGGIMATGSTGTTTITGSGSMTAKSFQGYMIIETDDSDNLVLGVPITDNGGPVDLIKGGGGKLVLDAPNSMTGNVFVNGGTLELTARGELFDSYVHQEDDGVTVYNAPARRRSAD